MFKKLKEHRFLFSELVKRDFKKKYKRTYLGMLWSVLSPLLSLLVMNVVFSQVFNYSSRPHFIIYLFCGNIVFSFFNEATNGGMSSLMSNSAIFTKINVPKYLFLFSRNVSSLINFGLTFIVFLLFCALDKVPLTPMFLLLIIPIICLVIFNLGIGLILSAMFVFFRDVQYLWSVFTMLIMYMSAIFYDPAGTGIEKFLYLNPIFVYIKLFRNFVLYNTWDPRIVLLGVAYALIAFGVGSFIYKRYNHKFLYYV